MNGGGGIADVARVLKSDDFGQGVIKDLDEKQRAILQQLLQHAAANMSTNSTKNGIDDIANRLKQNGSSSGGNLIVGGGEKSDRTNGNGATIQAPPEPQSISNHTPLMQLSCVECGVSKSNSEEMEVHIKMEHLNWLPFQCPMCLAERASDAQMREHLHSSHKKNMNKFIYVDNVQAKRQLQVLMDKAFSMNVTKRVNAAASSVTYSPNSYRGSNPSSGRNTSNGMSSAQATASAIVKQHKDKEKQQAQAAADILKLLDFSAYNSADSLSEPVKHSTPKTTRKRPFVPTSASESITTSDLPPAAPATPTPSTTPAEQLLASFMAAAGAAATENEENDRPQFSCDDLNLDSCSALASLFGGKKFKYDDADVTTAADSSATLGDEESAALDALNPISVLDNVAALFGSAAAAAAVTGGDKESGGDGGGGAKKATASLSKKRVLGECSKCQKPVTAGARQMHMFFHLAKDENIFRFRCKHDACNVEHYRKDQMENHQSKVHGRIDPDMMEDRSLELFQKCQELNHELFVAHRHGSAAARSSPHSNNSSSSPCAGGVGVGGDGGSSSGGQLVADAGYQNAQKSKTSSTNASTTNGNTNGFGPLKLVPDEDHPLQCRLCGKTMQNRIRGFHILWHMAKDKGINRYTCKYCNFGHDRSQSVQVHGKKEHATDDCVEDRIGEYQDDVKEMSEACFGISSLFAQESKRKNKFPAATTPQHHRIKTEDSNSGNASPSTILDEELTIEGTSDQESVKVEEEEEVETEGDEEEEEEEDQEDDDEEEYDEVDEEEDIHQSLTNGVANGVSGSAKRKRRGGRFNIRAKKSRKQKEEALVMRNVSMLIGGAQFYRKKFNEFCYCEKCGKQTNSRIPEHAYTHMRGVQLFRCATCDIGHPSREILMKHMRDMHAGSAEKCVDSRLCHISAIKEAIRECFPAFFVDHPLPTRGDVERLVELAKSADVRLDGVEEYLETL